MRARVWSLPLRPAASWRQWFGGGWPAPTLTAFWRLIASVIMAAAWRQGLDVSSNWHVRSRLCHRRLLPGVAACAQRNRALRQARPLGSSCCHRVRHSIDDCVGFWALAAVPWPIPHMSPYSRPLTLSCRLTPPSLCTRHMARQILGRTVARVQLVDGVAGAGELHGLPLAGLCILANAFLIHTYSRRCFPDAYPCGTALHCTRQCKGHWACRPASVVFVNPWCL